MSSHWVILDDAEWKSSGYMPQQLLKLRVVQRSQSYPSSRAMADFSHVSRQHSAETATLILTAVYLSAGLGCNLRI